MNNPPHRLDVGDSNDIFCLEPLHRLFLRPYQQFVLVNRRTFVANQQANLSGLTLARDTISRKKQEHVSFSHGIEQMVDFMTTDSFSS